MESDYTYYILPFRSLHQPHDPELTKKRRSSSSFALLLHNFPNNLILKKAEPKESLGVCYNVALKEALGLSTKQFQKIQKSIVGGRDWVIIMDIPFKFFQQQKFPQRGSLAVYSSKNEIKHFGIITQNGRVKSKLGTLPYIIEHDYWDIYKHYGNRISFWELKKKYLNKNGKKILFRKIMHIVQKSEFMKQLLYEAQELLFNFAQNKCIDADWSICCLLPNDDPYNLIKTVMGLNINGFNKNGETALTLAAQIGNYSVVKLLLRNNATINLKNKNKKTALDLAWENKHYAIIKLIEKYNDKAQKI